MKITSSHLIRNKQLRENLTKGLGDRASKMEEKSYCNSFCFLKEKSTALGNFYDILD